MDTYQVGTGDRPIQLAVEINTNGFAWTLGFTIDEANETRIIPGCASKDANGDIPQMLIGTADTLRGKILNIVSKIDLHWDNQQEREIDFNNITAKYVLDGGDQQHEAFVRIDRKINSKGDFTVIRLIKNINLLG